MGSNGLKKTTAMKRTLLSLGIALLIIVFACQGRPLSPGGGPTLGWLPLDFTGLNEHLEQAGLPELELGLVLSGVSYFGGREGRKPAFVGLALSGRRWASRLERSTRLELLLTGLGLEYGEEASERFGLFVGGFIAPASLTLEVTHRPAEDFRSGLEKFSGTALSREFLAFALYAGGEWAFGIGRLRLSLGYLWAGATTNWKADGRDFPGPSGRFRAPLIRVVLVLGI